MTMKTIRLFIVAIVLLTFLPGIGFAQETKTPVRYSEFGAKGDGVTDDLNAIVKAHAEANERGLPVRADAGATYYIARTDKTAQVRTDTDWGDARFIIDDSKVDVKDRGKHIFNISSQLPSAKITTVKTLAKNQEKIDLEFPRDSFIHVTDATTKRYIRLGLNQNGGTNQNDVFLVDPNGHVDPTAPILWDFSTITSFTASPVDSETLRVQGGHFTTIANRAESKYTYYARGINVTRSNTVIDGVTHVITDELEHGAPYAGFLSVSGCAHVTVQNCEFSGHKTYSTIGSAGKPVSMGSYDISINRSVDVTFKSCKQLNDIHDTKLWGVFTSNFSKNITLDTVEFSRFDAHMGVAGATIRNSVLGHQGINIIGSGVFLLENTAVHSANFINLRGDYGSTFEGEFIIRDCRYKPRNGQKSDAVLISGTNSGRHDFGYTCFMPEKITIRGLFIDDGNPVDHYQGPKIFAPFNPAYNKEDYEEKFPYVITKELDIENLTTKSGKPWILSNHPFLFRNVKISQNGQTAP